MIGPAALLAAALQAPVSSCPVSADASFAVTREHAAQVGGGAMHAAARERRYLDALRGPNGEPIEYTRRGSLPIDREGRTILDVYEVTYRGRSQPATVYLDAYHFDDGLAAPHGFICAVPFALTAPGPDPFVAMEALRALAIEQGSSRQFAPIPLDADGTTRHGILLDGFRVAAHASRTTAAAGTRTDPMNPPRDLLRTRMIVIAYAITCGDEGKPAAPLSVDLVATDGPALRRDGDLVSGDALARLLPGLSAPQGSVAAVYPLDRPRVTDTLRITYAQPCGEAALSFKYSNGRAVNVPPAALPPGQPPTDRPVRIQAVLDLDGAVQQPVYSGGPVNLVDAAMAAVRQWTAEPVRLNGAPVATAVVLSVRFR